MQNAKSPAGNGGAFFMFNGINFSLILNKS
jgi:hypothetical protein